MPENDEYIEWVVLNPEAEYETSIQVTAPRVSDLNKKKIGLFWNAKPNGDVVLAAIGAVLGERFKDLELIEFHLSQGLRSPEEIKQMAERCDAVIAGVGD